MPWGAIGGALIGGLLSKSSAKASNSAAAREAEYSREFTKEQMQNKHQWEVDDLKKAGLNPILSAHGSGSVGGSALASTLNLGDSSAKGADSAIKALMARKIESEIDVNKATAKLTDAKGTKESTTVPAYQKAGSLLTDLFGGSSASKIRLRRK